MPFRLRKGFVGTRYFQIAEEACALAQSIYGLLLNGQYMKVCLKFLIHLHVYQKSHQHFTFSHQGSQTPTAHSFPDISSPLFSIPYIKFCYLPQHDSVKLIVSFMNVFRCQKNRTPKERVLDHLSIYLFICLFFYCCCCYDLTSQELAVEGLQWLHFYIKDPGCCFLSLSIILSLWLFDPSIMFLSYLQDQLHRHETCVVTQGLLSEGILILV